MSVELIGANPIATLTNQGARVAVVSMWDVAWSTYGAGRAVLVWADGDESIRLLTPHEQLGGWLAETFNRHFPEFEGLPEIADPIDCDITEWHIERHRARLDVVASDGLRVTTSISRPMQTRPAYASTFQLGDVPWTLTNLLTFAPTPSSRSAARRSKVTPRSPRTVRGRDQRRSSPLTRHGPGARPRNPLPLDLASTRTWRTRRKNLLTNNQEAPNR